MRTYLPKSFFRTEEYRIIYIYIYSHAPSFLKRISSPPLPVLPSSPFPSRSVALALDDPRVGSPGLSGHLDPALDRLSALAKLSLIPSCVMGSIPNTLSLCPDLCFLALSKNFLSGPIPDSLDSLRHLRTLDLSYNQLSGSVPPPVSSIPTLANLVLCHNRLSGSIPSFPDSASLLRLDLKHNNLTGPFPALPPSLQYFSLTLNQNKSRIMTVAIGEDKMLRKMSRSSSWPIFGCTNRTPRHRCHVLSTSLMCCFHPHGSHFDDEILARHAASTVLGRLNALADLLLLPKAQEPIRGRRRCCSHRIDSLLDDFLRLTHAHGSVRAALNEFKRHQSHAQATLHRNDEAHLASAVCAQHRTKKDLVRLAAAIRDVRRSPPQPATALASGQVMVGVAVVSRGPTRAPTSSPPPAPPCWRPKG